MTRVAVIGNTPRNIGAHCAADLALCGHEVRYALLTEDGEALRAVLQHGGFEAKGDAAAFVAERTGHAKLAAICEDPKEALAGAEVVLLDADMHQLERQFAPLIPALPRDVVVLAQSYGYWAAARLAALLRAQNRDDVTVCEAAVPTHAAALAGHVVTGLLLRRGVEVASFPGHRIEAALARLRTLVPALQAAPSVLQTSLESMNLMVHPAMVLLGVGLMEQAQARGDKVRFYADCNVPSAGRLAEAMDAERGRVCAAYGLRHQTLPAAIEQFYGTSGQGVQASIANCASYQSIPGAPAGTWRGWEAVDVPYAIVPLVRLAEQADVPAPLHRALAEILGTVLGLDPWSASPSLQAMGLIGTPPQVAARFA